MLSKKSARIWDEFFAVRDRALPKIYKKFRWWMDEIIKKRGELNANRKRT